MALSDVTIFRRGGMDPKRLSASAIRASWEVSAPGALTCDLVTSELIAAGLPLDLESYWLEWEHPTAGRWGGVITDSGETSEGTFKVAAGGYALLMERRFIGLAAPGSAGALLRQAISQASASNPMFLTFGVIDQSGGAITVPPDLMHLLESLVPLLIEATGYEWQVSPERVVTWLPRIGAVRSASVRLAQGLHLSTYQTAGSRPLIENVLYGVGQYPWSHTTPGRRVRNPNWKKGSGRWKFKNIKPVTTTGIADIANWAVDQTSINRHGRLDGQRDLGVVPSAAWFNAILSQMVLQSANPPRSATATLVEVAGEWATFREGDTVRLVLGDAAVEYDYRILVRAIDVDAGTMEVAGEATHV